MAQAPAPQARQPPEPPRQFRVWIRCPFPRGDFVDPPQVDWNADQDQRLWAILSRTSRSSDLDWDSAKQFNVTTPFILQQAAWLYERQLSTVRDQMRRVTKDSLPTTANHGEVVTEQQHSADSEQPSNFADSVPDNALTQPQLVEEPSKDTMMPPNVSTSVAVADSTTLPLRQSQTSPKSQDVERPSQPRKYSTPSTHNPAPSRRSSLGSSASESDDADDDDERGGAGGGRLGMLRQKAFKRPGTRFGASRNNLFRSAQSRPTLGSEPSDQEDAPPFLAFRRPTDELTATLKGRPAGTESAASEAQEAKRAGYMESSVVSSDPSDAAPYQQRQHDSTPSSPESTRKPGSSAASKRALQAQASDGSPSMGSSFSDLEDTSVTKSALEEALLSNMQRAGGSRMSTLSQARPTRRD